MPGCNRDALGSGDQCTRSSECDVGLVCVEGACSSSLAGLENPGTVPMVMMGEEMPMEGNADAGVNGDAGGATDAGMGMPDVEPGFQP